jgi:hypothetical protein
LIPNGVIDLIPPVALVDSSSKKKSTKDICRRVKAAGA